MELKKTYASLMLAALLCAIVGLSVFWHHGPARCDGWVYTRCAMLLAQTGKIPFEAGFFANRIGAYFVEAMLIKAWGFSPWFSLLGMAELLVLVTLTYACVSSWSRTAGLWAAFFVGLGQQLMSASGSMMGDMTVTLAMNAPLLIFFKARQRGSGGMPAVWGGVAGLWFFYGILAKESPAFYVPCLLGIAIMTRKDPRSMSFWKAFGAAVALPGIALLAWYWIKTGNPLYRLAAVESGPTMSTENYSHLPFFPTVFLRITVEPFKFLLESYSFGCLFFLSLLQMVRTGVTKQENFFRWWLALTLPLWWSWTQSFHSWNPVAMAHRLWLPLVVPLAINAACSVVAIVSGNLSRFNRRRMIAAVGAFAVLMVPTMCFSAYQHARAGLPGGFFLAMACYGALAASVLVALRCTLFRMFSFLPARAVRAGLGTVVMAPWIVWGSLNAVNNSKGENQYAQAKKAFDYLQQHCSGVVLAHPFLADNYGIFTEFSDSLNVKGYAEFASLLTPPPGMFFITNPRDDTISVNETMVYTKIVPPTVPSFAKTPEHYGARVAFRSETYVVYEFR